MELEINEGVTLVHQHESKNYVVVHTKEVHLEEIMRQLTGFLLAVGFTKRSIDEYIALD